MDTPSLGEILPRLFVSMTVVILVMAAAARLLRSRQLPGMRGMVPPAAMAKRVNPIQVIARQGIGRNQAVAIVKAGDKTLVLGLSSDRVSLLTELGSQSSETEQSVEEIVNAFDIHGTDVVIDNALASSGSSGKGLLSQVREITVRKGI